MSQRKFLVVADDTPEFQAALRFACRRARSTGGYVALLRVIEPEYFEHWSGVREEIERQAREEAEALLQTSAALVQAETGLPPEFIIKNAENVRTALREVIGADPDIKILGAGAERAREVAAPTLAEVKRIVGYWAG